MTLFSFLTFLSDSHWCVTCRRNVRMVYQIISLVPLITSMTNYICLCITKYLRCNNIKTANVLNARDVSYIKKKRCLQIKHWLHCTLKKWGFCGKSSQYFYRKFKDLISEDLNVHMFSIKKLIAYTIPC